eukprot:jgi/Tetstr1/458270/TSEL_044758.t1
MAADEAAAARASALRLSFLLPQLPDCWAATATRPVAFHTLLPAASSAGLALEQLRELSSRREALAGKRTGVEGSPDAGAEEHARKDFTHWPLKYISLFERFTQQADSLMDSSTAAKLVFQWNSPLGDQPGRFFKLTTLPMERAMAFYMYGAALQQQGYHIASVEATPGSPMAAATAAAAADARHADAATMLRRAAGVFTFLADCVLPSVLDDLPAERPAELVPATAGCLASCALAEAQAVVAHRAMLKGASAHLVSQLHMGVSELMEAASKRLKEGMNEYNSVSSRLRRYIAISSTLHQAMAAAYQGQRLLQADGQAGVAVALCDHAAVLLQKCTHASEGDTRWNAVIAEAGKLVQAMRGHFDTERNMVYYQGIAKSVPKPPEAKVIVQAIEFTPPCDSAMLC